MHGGDDALLRLSGEFDFVSKSRKSFEKMIGGEITVQKVIIRPEVGYLLWAGGAPPPPLPLAFFSGRACLFWPLDRPKAEAQNLCCVSSKSYIGTVSRGKKFNTRGSGR